MKKLELMKKEYELQRVKTAKMGMLLDMEKMLDQIERMKVNVEKQDKCIAEIESELNGEPKNKKD